MPTEHRSSRLLSILSTFNNTRITVRSVRDELLVQNNEATADKSAIRRWVHGKFVTLVRQGLLSKHRDEGTGKVYFQVTALFDLSKHLPTVNIDRKVISTPDSLDNVKQELKQYQRTMVSQLCEIEEYKRVRDVYPDLGDLAESQFHCALEENYRLLGRVKALEKILANRDIALQ